MDRITSVVFGLLGAVTAVFSTWCTVIAFVGGTMPIVGWETEGGIGFGLVWLMVINPIVLTVCWWISVVVAAPFIAASAHRERRHGGDPER